MAYLEWTIAFIGCSCVVTGLREKDLSGRHGRPATGGAGMGPVEVTGVPPNNRISTVCVKRSRNVITPSSRSGERGKSEGSRVASASLPSAGHREGRRRNLAALATLGLEGGFPARVMGAGKAARHREQGRHLPPAVALAVTNTSAPKMTPTRCERANPRHERVTRDPAGPVFGERAHLGLAGVTVVAVVVPVDPAVDLVVEAAVGLVVGLDPVTIFSQ